MLNRLYCAALARALILADFLRHLVVRGLCASVAFIAPLARADGDVADMLNRLAEGAKTGTGSTLTIAQFIGVVGIVGSLVALKSMKVNPQIRPWHVGLGFVVSLLLMAIPELIKRGQVQMGLTPVSTF